MSQQGKSQNQNFTAFELSEHVQIVEFCFFLIRDFQPLFPVFLMLITDNPVFKKLFPQVGK